MLIGKSSHWSLLLVTTALLTAVAAAQAPDPSVESTPPRAAEAQTPAPQPVAGEAEEPRDWDMAAVTLSPQVGYAFFPAASYTYDGITLDVDNRNAFVGKVHLDLGGDGVAFELAPLFALEKLGGDLTSISGDIKAGPSGKFVVFGGQVGLVLRGGWGRFHPHLGAGLHAAAITGDDIRYGVELYGRVPAGFTLDLGKHVGLVLEAAFLFGATGIRYPDPDTSELAARLQSDYNLDIDTIDWNTTTPEELQAQYQLTDAEVKDLVEEQVSKTFKFGTGIAFEVSVGLRFP